MARIVCDCGRSYDAHHAPSALVLDKTDMGGSLRRIAEVFDAMPSKERATLLAFLQERYRDRDYRGYGGENKR